MSAKLERVARDLARSAARLEVPLNVEAEFAAYRADPVRFVRDVLGFASAVRRSDGSAYQDEILEVVRDVPRVALVTGHGVGKTRTLAATALWWLLSRTLSRVVILAPQFERQVRGVIFAEIRRLVRRARRPLPLEVHAGRVFVEGYGEEWAIVGMPATEPDRLEGQHAEGGLLLLMDETKGVPQGVFDAMMGSLTGGDDSRLLVASTPGGIAGPFYRACTDIRGLWRTVRLSAEDSSIVSPGWCEDRAADWGRESPLYQTRVQGTFADGGEGQLFGLSLLEAASSRALVPDGAVILGVDVARSVTGDRNCIAVARGGRVERLVLWRSPDLMATVTRVVQEVSVAGAKKVRVDATGVGAGVVDRLRELHYPVEGLHFGGSASDPSRFRNARAERFWALREALEKGTTALPPDEELWADLSAIRYSFNQAGRIVLEGKDETRKRLGRSPDRGDAVALALGRDVAPDIPRVMPYAVPRYTLDGEIWGGWI